MKMLRVLALPLILLSLATFADDTIVEFTGETGCSKCQFNKETGATKCGASIKVGAKVYELTGPVLKKEMPGCCGEEGTYKVKGKLSADGKSIEVTEITNLKPKKEEE